MGGKSLRAVQYVKTDEAWLTRIGWAELVRWLREHRGHAPTITIRYRGLNAHAYRREQPSSAKH